MSASPLPKNTPDDELAPLEAVPGPIARQSVEKRLLGLPARFALLCLGFGMMATPTNGGGVVGEAADAQLEDAGPNAPYPPRDEGDPPQPAQVPEPHPPPAQGTSPAPAPDSGQTKKE